MSIYDKNGNRLSHAYNANGSALAKAYDINGRIIYPDEPHKIKVLEYNVGNFSQSSGGGTGGYSGNDLSGYISTWENFFNEQNAPIALITESRKYIDSNDTTLAKTALYDNCYSYYLDHYQSYTPWGKVLLTDAPQRGTVTKKFQNQRSSASSYCGATITLFNVDIFVVCVHFIHDENNADVRALQMQELVNDISGYNNVIVGGDLNTSSLSELSVLENAGFTFANGTFGTYNTWEVPNPTYPLDNVGVRGSNLELESFQVLTTKTLSDHYPTVTEINVI